MEPLISLSSSSPQFTRQILCEFDYSWIVCSTQSIDDIVSYRTEGTSSEACIETGGISLKLPEGSACSDSRCSLIISSKWPLQVKVDAIDILASARHMELFSSSGEYLATSQGFRVDEELGCHDRLYALQYSFEEPISRFTVKFVSLEVPTELFLHSIHVTMCMTSTKDSTPMPTPHPLSLFGDLAVPRVDMEKVTTMLSEMGKQLTPQAEDLMHSIHSKQMKERSKNVGDMPAVLVSMLSQLKNQSVESKASAFSVPFGSIAASQGDLLSLFTSGLSQNNVSLGQKPDFTELTSQEFSCDIASSSACGTVESSKLAPYNRTMDHSDCTSAKEVLSKCSCSTSASSERKLERCLHCNAPLSLGCLEQRLLLAVEETEKRLEKHLTDSIRNMERRLSERLDSLLMCLRPNVTSNIDTFSERQEPGLD